MSKKISKTVDSENTIQRCPHDKQNPYTMVLNTLIRDNNISPNCRLILIYLLSMKNDWVIRMSQLCKEFKDHLGKDNIYKIINEAIEAGYMSREQYLKNNLLRYRYYLSEEPKFKKCFRYPDSQDTGAQDPENQETLYKNKKELCEEYPPPSVPPEPRIPKPPPKKEVSLRSEEEDSLVKELLKDTILSPKETKRILESNHSAEAIRHAVQIAKTQEVKKSFMGLLLKILNNPEDWTPIESPQSQPLSPREQKALRYNKKLSKIEPKIAEENEKTIPKGYMKVIVNDKYEQISLNSQYFESDFNKAEKEIDNYI